MSLIEWIAVGVAAIWVILVTIWINYAKSGELQIYETEEGTYTALNIESTKVFNKRWILLRTRKYGSQK